MILESLHLANFKNIATADLDFSAKINCFLGDNGMGKSNLLDAIYFLSFCKSFSGAQDAQLIRRGDDFAMIRAQYFRRGLPEELQASLRSGQRKIMRRAGKPLQRLADHIGSFPLVILSPADMNLVAGEPAERRRFIDQIISQRDARYLDSLLRYNAALEQRNRLLRDQATDPTLYEALELQLEMAGAYIERCRTDNINRLSGIFAPLYAAIAGRHEEAALAYRHTDYADRGGLAAHLAAGRPRDLALGYTASGTHRDDIDFSIDGMSVRRSASQGQTKTFTTALRFAHYELLREALGLKPLLLLDDIFDKLDAGRVHRIMEIVGTSGSFGQIFITDTNRRHLDDIIADIPAAETPGRLFHVEAGIFTPITI